MFAMMDKDLGFRVKELSKKIEMMGSQIDLLRDQINENELWDNNDMMRNWKVSQRTIASWRSEGSIDYVKKGSKILYPKESREAFLLRNMVKGINSDAKVCSN